MSSKTVINDGEGGLIRDLRCLKILIVRKKRFERSFKKERNISVHTNGKAIYKGEGRFLQNYAVLTFTHVSC